jgi:hypothetical protein
MMFRRMARLSALTNSPQTDCECMRRIPGACELARPTRNDAASLDVLRPEPANEREPGDVAADLRADGDEYGPVRHVALLLVWWWGLWWGATAGLRVERLNMLKRRVDVAEALSDPRGVETFGTPKAHERRSVPFPAFLAELLAARCDGKGRGDLVFSTPTVRCCGAATSASALRSRRPGAAVGRP